MNRRQGTITAAALLSAGAVAVGVLPALAHPSFPAAPALGFQPNPTGGGGQFAEPPPYAAASTPTLSLFVPGEQTEPFQGRDDTTTSVTVSIPQGWTNPTCGQARTEVVDASTSGSPQPGQPVAGWTCAVQQVSGRAVVRWSGPQVPAGQFQRDSAQFFVLSVTTPSPARRTTYDGLNGTEGFAVDQVYASGARERWIPTAGYAGGGVVAEGLARTVDAPAGASPGPTSSPTASPTANPTASPTGSPTASPTASPTGSPTVSPTASPTAPPTGSPAPSPTCGTGATASAKYVQRLFSTVLLRCAEPAAESRFAGQLDAASTTRLALARGVVLSPEGVARGVGLAYRELVGRTPGAEESSAWTRAVVRDRSARTLLSRLLGSDELYAGGLTASCSTTTPDASATRDDRWLAVAYCTALGRTPDAAGAAAWKTQLGATSTVATRTLVAERLLSSGEAAARAVRTTYAGVLQREASATEVQRGADYLRGPLRGRELELTAQVLASDESYGIAQR